MSLQQVYITKAAKFLPNEVVQNDEIEDYLGLINGKPSKSKNIVLRNNGIKQRYYALDKQGNPTHTNYGMAALAIQELFKDGKFKVQDLQLLSCGTSVADQLMPSHAVMVHGEIKDAPSIEVVSPAGVCAAGMPALKYAFLSIKSGQTDNAICSGSERLSPILKASSFENEVQKLAQMEENPYLSFEKDFLRWMLSDGAAAFLLQNKPNENELSLRIDWIEGISYANKEQACMYMGSDKNPDGSIKSYLDFTKEEIEAHSVMAIKQDVKLLSANIVEFGYKVKDVCDQKGFDLHDVDYFLPHMSSEFFRSKIDEKFRQNGVIIPQEKWFTNLSTKGNVGACSIYLMVEELFNSSKLKKGQKIILLVPESSRFSYVFSLMTVV